jgi:hypothetical protein
MTCVQCKQVSSQTWYTVVRSTEGRGVDVDLFCSSDCVKEAF